MGHICWEGERIFPHYVLLINALSFRNYDYREMTVFLKNYPHLIKIYLKTLYQYSQRAPKNTRNTTIIPEILQVKKRWAFLLVTEKKTVHFGDVQRAATRLYE